MRLLQYMNSVINTSLIDTSDPHQSVMEALLHLYSVAENDNEESKLEMDLRYARGTWLEDWASYFGLIRRNLKRVFDPWSFRIDGEYWESPQDDFWVNGGYWTDKQDSLPIDGGQFYYDQKYYYVPETDEELRQEILESVNKPKVDKPDMRYLIADWINENYGYDTNYTADDIIIYERYKDTLVYSHTDNSYSTHYRYSGGRYGRCMITIVIPENLTDELYDYVMSIKAAGVQVWFLRDVLDGIGGIDVVDYRPVVDNWYYLILWKRASYNMDNELQIAVIRDYYHIEDFEFLTWESAQHSLDTINEVYTDTTLTTINDFVVKVNAASEVELIPHTSD